MKNYVSYGIVCLSLVISSSMMARMPQYDFDDLKDAIEKSHLEDVERLLALHTLDYKQQDELLGKATIILKEKEERKSLFKSSGDLAKFTSGVALTLGGSLFSLRAFCGSPASGIPSKLLALLGLGSGIYLIKEGWSCSRAEELYKNARRIKGLIQEAPFEEKR